MIKFLQHARGWTFGSDTVGVATVVINGAWQFPETDKADALPPLAMKPGARSLLNTLLMRPRSTGAVGVRLRESATWPV
jgi:hypothetical protein